MVIHNPETFAWGDETEMKRVKEMLAEIKEAIINAYELKTKLPRTRISKLMDDESWMNVKKAMELGFADGMLYSEGAENKAAPPVFNAVLFSKADLRDSLMKKVRPPVSDVKPQPSNGQNQADDKSQNMPPDKPDDKQGRGVSISALYRRLFLLNLLNLEVS